MKKTIKSFSALITSLLMLTVIIGQLECAAAAKKINAELKTSSSTVGLGKTITLDVNLTFFEFTASDAGVYKISNLKVGYDASSFDYISLSKNGIEIEYNKTGNPVIISYNSAGYPDVETINKSCKLCSITFKAKTSASTGTANFILSQAVFTDSDNNTITSTAAPASVKVTITDSSSSQATSSSKAGKAYLDSLRIREGDLDPKFDKNITAYRCLVDNNVTKINVQYGADYRIYVSVTGVTDNLKVGENIVKVNLSGLGGSNVYTIIVTRSTVNGNYSSSSRSLTSSLSEVEQARLEGETTAMANYNKKMQAEKNRNFIIDIVLFFIILSELALIVLDRISKRTNKKTKKE